MPDTRRTAAALLLACGLLAACGDDTTGADGAAPPPDQATQEETEPVGDDGQPVAEGPRLDTPAGAAQHFLRSVGQSQFGAACQVLTPGNQTAIARRGTDCQSYLNAEIREEDRPQYAAVEIDESQIEVLGDTATVPHEALTVPGTPQDQDEFDIDIDLNLIAGRWHVALG